MIPASVSASMTVAGVMCPSCSGSMFSIILADVDTREVTDQYTCTQCGGRIEFGRTVREMPHDLRYVAKHEGIPNG